MQAIATLVENDPYLRLPFAERLHARRARRERIAAKAVPDKPIALRVVSIVEVEPIAEPDNWAERQKKIPLPKDPWFSIIEEIEPAVPLRPTIDQIQRAVCKYTNIAREDMLSQRRTSAVVYARQVGFYLCKVLTLRSLPEIGRKFAGRDHTTILHGMRKIERLIPTCPDLAADLEAIKAIIAVPA